MNHFTPPSGTASADHDSYLQTLYNDDDATCYVTSQLLSWAEAAPNHLAVHPITPAMKFPRGFTEDLEAGKVRRAAVDSNPNRAKMTIWTSFATPTEK